MVGFRYIVVNTLHTGDKIMMIIIIIIIIILTYSMVQSPS